MGRSDRLPSLRMRRVAEMLHETVAGILCYEVQDPRMQLLTITRVDVSADLKNSTIYYSLVDVEQLADVEIALAKASGFVRKQLAKQAVLRTTPKLAFVYDNTAESGMRIDNILHDIKLTDDTDQQDSTPYASDESE